MNAIVTHVSLLKYGYSIFTEVMLKMFVDANILLNCSRFAKLSGAGVASMTRLDASRVSILKKERGLPEMSMSLL